MSEEESFGTKRNQLRATEDLAERNRLALELSDAGDAQTFSVLVELLRQLPTNRGTLLYALASYDCTSIRDLLSEIAVSGNWEERTQAGAILGELSKT